MALLKYQSVEQVTAIISLGSTYLNMVVKDFVFTLKRKNIEELWHRLEDDDFRVKTINELRWFF